MELTLDLPMLAGKSVSYMYDNSKRQTEVKKAKVGKDGHLRVTIQNMGGIIITE